MTTSITPAKWLARTDFRQGRFLVRLVIPDAGSLEFKQTFAEHHYTIFATPEQLTSYADAEAVPILAALGD